MRTKQIVVSEFRRTEILDAARAVFGRRGFDRGLMDEIAKEAGIAKGTIYLYYRSKSEVFRAVLDHDLKAMNRLTLERLDAAPTLKEKIRAFTQIRLEIAESRRDFFRIMDGGGGLAFTRQQYYAWLQEPVLHLAAAIEEAVKRGEVPAQPAEKAAWAIADITRGTIQRRLIGKQDRTLLEDAEFLAEFIWPALVNGGGEALQ